MYEEITDTLGRPILIHGLDLDNEIQIESDVPIYCLSIDQTKQLIEFLTKQIEGK